MLGQRTQLAFHVAGDVVVVVRFVGPAEPDLGDLPRFEPLGQQLLEEMGIAGARKDRVQGDRAGRPVVRVIEVLVAEESLRAVS